MSENANSLAGSTAIAAKLTLWDDQGDELVNLPYSRENRALRIQPVAHYPRSLGALVYLNPSTSLKVKLGAAVAATQASVSVAWADVSKNEVLEGQSENATNSTTDVTAAAAPSAGYVRAVKTVIICNRDTASIAVSLMVDNGTQYFLLSGVVLLAGETLMLSQTGLVVIPASASGRTETRHLSGSTSGRPIKVAATGTPGTLIHTAVSGSAQFDGLCIFANNTSNAAVMLTLEWGGTTSPDDLNEISIPGEHGKFLVVNGDKLNGGVAVRAFAGSANVINITGWVERK